MKASELLEFAEKRLGKGYVYGTFGQVYTQALAKQKDAQYGSKMGADYYFKRCSKWFGVNVCDCIGLFKWFVFDKLGVSYSAAWDVSADGAYSSWCDERGSIATMKKEPGIAVFMPGHIGIYIGGGKVIEARGADYGVVKTNLSDRPFTKWGRLKWLTYDLSESGAAKTPAPETQASPKVQTSPDTPQAARTGSVTGDTVNIRSGPGTSYSIVGIARRGERVNLLSSSGDWWNIDSGKWISGKYVKAGDAAKTGVITGSSVNVRSGAGTAYPIIGNVKKGDTIPLLSSKNGWWEAAPGRWVSGTYVKVST